MPDKQNKRILIIDDDADYVQLIRTLLEDEGYLVATAASGLQASQQLPQMVMDLIIVDGKLPDIDGVDWIQQFRERHLQTPIIFASSLWYSREEVARLKSELDVGLVLHKPLSPSMFCLQVSQLMSGTTERPEKKEATDKAHWDAKMDRIRFDYRDRLLERLERLYQTLFQCWEETCNGPAMKESMLIAHRLRGSAGTFGYHLAGTCAGEIEDGLLAWRNQDRHPDWAYMVSSCERARKSITQEASLEMEVPSIQNTGSKGRVLVLDDDVVFLAMITDILSTRGFEVVPKSQPGDLKSLLSKVNPDLVLLDVAMPFPDGFTVCKQLRSLPQWQWLPVLFLTVKNDEQTRIKAFRAQADDFICKPIVGEELVARIEVRLERQHLLREHTRALKDLENSHEALYSVLQQLHIGVVILGPDHIVTFISDSCRRLLGIDRSMALGKTWHQVLNLQADDISHLRQMASLPPERRSRLKLALEVEQHHLWLEVDVRDDPRQKDGRILYFNDVSELYNLRNQVQGSVNHKIVGKSRAMVEMFRTMQQLSRGDWTVLIEGETGVGKELVARAIHDTSTRCKGPFIAVNCGGLSESLLSSQLFGHKRGSFSGAIANQDGFFTAANNGTLFLDEIGEFPQSVQTSLLRVLQDGEITPLGEVLSRKVNVRIIVATHRTLSEEVKAGFFRQDLFYRLQVGRITVPTLRERRQDIPLLVKHFLEKENREGARVGEVCQDAMARLTEYPWPGNVRELENAIAFSAIHAEDHVLQIENLPPEIRNMNLTPTNRYDLDVLPPALGRFHPEEEKRRIVEALHQAGGNRTQAARLLGMGRATLYRRLTELELDAQPEK